MHSRHLLALACCIALAAGAPARVSAQAYQPLFRAGIAPATHLLARADTVRQSNEEGMDPISSSSMFMGVIGALGGAALGGASSSNCDKTCRGRNSAAGASIGAGVFIPVGAHVGNNGRGNIFKSALVTTAVGLAGYGLASAVPGRPTAAVVFLTLPIEVVLATKIERSTTRVKK